MDGGMTIGELADRSGLSRRAVRFYVQQKLLPPPLGGGRGAHYGALHLERLSRIGQLQAAGQSLDAIRRIFEGKTVSPPLPPSVAQSVTPRWSAELWTRVKIVEGVELHFDAKRRPLDVRQLMEIREAVLQAVNGGKGDSDGTA